MGDDAKNGSAMTAKVQANNKWIKCSKSLALFDGPVTVEEMTELVKLTELVKREKHIQYRPFAKNASGTKAWLQGNPFCCQLKISALSKNTIQLPWRPTLADAIADRERIQKLMNDPSIPVKSTPGIGGVTLESEIKAIKAENGEHRKSVTGVNAAAATNRKRYSNLAAGEDEGSTYDTES